MSGIALWFSTSDALLTLYFSTFVSFIAYLPTIKKAYFLPETENTLSWTMTFCTALVNVCALTSFRVSIALPPVIGVFTSGTVAYLLLFHHAHNKLARRRKSPKIHSLLSHPLFVKWAQSWLINFSWYSMRWPSKHFNLIQREYCAKLCESCALTFWSAQDLHYQV